MVPILEDQAEREDEAAARVDQAAGAVQAEAEAAELGDGPGGRRQADHSTTQMG